MTDYLEIAALTGVGFATVAIFRWVAAEYRRKRANAEARELSKAGAIDIGGRFKINRLKGVQLGASRDALFFGGDDGARVFQFVLGANGAGLKSFRDVPEWCRLPWPERCRSRYRHGVSMILNHEQAGGFGLPFARELGQSAPHERQRCD